MKRSIFLMVLAMIVCLSTAALVSCGSKNDTDYEHLRDVSWEGKELTIMLGENKSTGCDWTTKPEDDKVIDYSTKRVFHMAGGSNGEAVGTLEAVFEGKGAGTSRIICTTPVGWDGKGDGFTYIVTVTVNEDGTIESAEGKEADSAPDEGSSGESTGEGTSETKGTEATLESYFDEHPGELKEMEKNINDDENIKKMVDVSIEVKGNTLSYIYTFKETYSKEQIDSFKPDLKKSMEGEVTEDMKGRIKDIEKGFGVKGVKLYMEYRNGDGSKILGTMIE